MCLLRILLHIEMYKCNVYIWMCPIERSVWHIPLDWTPFKFISIQHIRRRQAARCQLITVDCGDSWTNGSWAHDGHLGIIYIYMFYREFYAAATWRMAKLSLAAQAYYLYSGMPSSRNAWTVLIWEMDFTKWQKYYCLRWQFKLYCRLYKTYIYYIEFVFTPCRRTIEKQGRSYKMACENEACAPTNTFPWYIHILYTYNTDEPSNGHFRLNEAEKFSHWTFSIGVCGQSPERETTRALYWSTKTTGNTEWGATKAHGRTTANGRDSASRQSVYAARIFVL